MPDSTEPKPEVLPVLDASQGSKYVSPEDGIGQRIKELRTKLSISVETLSALTAKYDYDMPSESGKGVSVPTLYRYEKSERLPGAREIRLLCDALKTTPNWLVIGQEADSKTAANAKIADLARQLFSLIGDASHTQSGDAWPAVEHMLKLNEAKIEADDPSQISKNIKIRSD